MIAETAHFLTAHADGSAQWLALTLWAFAVWATATAGLYLINRRRKQ